MTLPIKGNMADRRIIVVGAGVGGLTTAAVLAKRGYEVTVLEAQAYPGGCAGSFPHKGYLFDAGATLSAGFYPSGPMDIVSKQTGASWRAEPATIAMRVHLPGGLVVDRPTDGSEAEIGKAVFGDAGKRFFDWQQEAADQMWALAMRLPQWPPSTIGDAADITSKGLTWLKNESKGLGWVHDVYQKVCHHLPQGQSPLRLFVDGQLLISAQAESDQVNALYGAAALDLPRRGMVHLHGGMGAIATGLVAAISQNGGDVRYKETVQSVQRQANGKWIVYTKKGNEYPADVVVANLPPWDARALLAAGSTQPKSHLPSRLWQGWGAFILHLGVGEHVFEGTAACHHQVLRGYPLGEGNSAFISVSPADDITRAPIGFRAVSISTHTNLRQWWQLQENEPTKYNEEKARLTEKVMESAEVAFPGISAAASFIMAGTPVTYQRYTGRSRGWVGGFPQTSLFSSVSPRVAKDFWLVGDSIFPGQSTAAVALGGLRVAQMIGR